MSPQKQTKGSRNLPPRKAKAAAPSYRPPKRGKTPKAKTKKLPETMNAEEMRESLIKQAKDTFKHPKALKAPKIKKLTDYFQPLSIIPLSPITSPQKSTPLNPTTDPVMLAIEAAGLSEFLKNDRNLDVNKNSPSLSLIHI